MAEPPAWRERTAKYSRDVSVNIVANLITAAIVYTVAVVGGYLKPNWILTPILGL